MEQQPEEGSTSAFPVDLVVADCADATANTSELTVGCSQISVDGGGPSFRLDSLDFFGLNCESVLLINPFSSKGINLIDCKA